VISKQMYAERLAQSGRPALMQQSLGAADGRLRMLGELDGEWTNVDAYVCYTQDFTADYPDIGHLQVLLRGYVATRESASNRYRVDWDRRIYWLDLDGDGPGIPHIVGALEFESAYVPQPGDDFPEFSKLPEVIQQCTMASPCSLNWTPFVLFRDPFTDYSAYPDEAAEADLLFVANAAGDVVAIAVDVYDAAGQYDFTTTLEPGDALQLANVGYKLSEPGFVYLLSLMDFATVQTGVRIEREHYTPGEDFLDPFLVGLEAGTRSIKLLLDAYSEGGGNAMFAFGGPFTQGFNWSQAPDFLFRGNMESLTPDGTSTGLEP
jgi:hypothetical protein